MNDALLDDLARGNPDKPKGKIPVEFFERPEDVAAACPYDGSTFLAGAYGPHLVGEITEQGRVEIAGAGSGKSVQLTSELILYEGSVAVVDPKGELSKNTAAYRAEVLGHDVYCLDLGNGLPANLNKYQSCWNPLATCDPQNEDFLERIGLIADGLILQQPGTETHWNDAAKEFLTGLMILTVLCPLFDKKDLLTVHDLLSTGYDDEP
jgi:type IV secretion system protein VirD4